MSATSPGFDEHDAAPGDVVDADATDDVTDLLELLELAHRTVRWADQCHEGIASTAGGQHYWPKRQAYMIARLAYMAKRRALTSDDIGGCTWSWNGTTHSLDPTCVYHQAAARQPWNHQIPWNCPTFYDVCNGRGANAVRHTDDDLSDQIFDSDPADPDSD